jgi:hypothetical protein
MSRFDEGGAGRSALRRRRSAPLVLLCLLLAVASAAREEGIQPIPAAEAARRVGELATVCGHVASAAHITSVKGSPTFLNLGRPYPDQELTVVIWEAARARFGSPPERAFDGKSICVTGRIQVYQGRLQIIVQSPDQIWIADHTALGEDLSEIERILVKALLSQLGHETDYGTGEWNQETIERTKAFQEASGLTRTGGPDPATLRALAAAVGEIPEADRTMVIRLLLFEIVRRLE